MKPKYTEAEGIHYALQFVLEQAREEPPLKRAQILLSANRFTAEERVSEELTSLAYDFIDLTQACHRYLAKVREENCEEVDRISSIGFLLEKAEDISLKLLVELLNGQVNFLPGNPKPGGVVEWDEYVRCYDRVRAWEARHDLLLLRLRTRHYDMSNAEAAALDTEPEPLKAV